jgi:hypothetical protein
VLDILVKKGSTGSSSFISASGWLLTSSVG